MVLKVVQTLTTLITLASAAHFGSSSSTGRCTTSGCTCQQTWSFGSQTITNYCGNPDNDPGGPWCFVVSASCQGNLNWGTCAPGTCGGSGQYSQYTCSSCMAAGSSNAWCTAGALCATGPMNSATLLAGDAALCPHDAWVSSSGCVTQPYSDPFYETNAWAFNLINVRPVWAAGFTRGARLLADSGVREPERQGSEGRMDPIQDEIPDPSYRPRSTQVLICVGRRCGDLTRHRKFSLYFPLCNA